MILSQTKLDHYFIFAQILFMSGLTENAWILIPASDPVSCDTAFHEASGKIHRMLMRE